MYISILPQIAHSSGGLCCARGYRQPDPQCLCDQEAGCGRVSQADGRDLRSRHFYCELVQGKVSNIEGKIPVIRDHPIYLSSSSSSSSSLQYADPVLDMLDVHQVVKHRLFRESCLNHKGNYVKVCVLNFWAHQLFKLVAKNIKD